MATFKTLEDIIVWQKARIYHAHLKEEVRLLQSVKDFELKEQLKSSSGSVMDNIAEGFGRMGNKEFKNFLTIAHDSLQESISQLYRLYDYDYITIERLNLLKAMASEISRLLRSLIETLQTSEIKGVKFK
ncbi:MAG TPA: four helix bundle protein [Chitinophagaceae bacterium]|jgi:four helix bundle protein|nr:four helix bundle protein [Chitinophagaceae bacterium]